MLGLLSTLRLIALLISTSGETTVLNERFEPRIEDPSGTALVEFFAALDRTNGGQEDSITRVLHMGDSSIGLDGLPHAIRRRMQARFGDAGPGFVLLNRYSQNYKSRVVGIQGEGWDTCYIAYLCRKDGHYGLGGHSFRGRRGAKTRFRTGADPNVGQRVSSAELWFARFPGGGTIELRIDQRTTETIDTSGTSLSSDWHRIEFEPGIHTIDVQPRGSGRVLAFGMVLENRGPGVVWDTVSLSGAFTKRLHGYDKEHIARQIEHRESDLLMLNFGGNDLRRIVSGSVTGDVYKEEYRRVLKKLHVRGSCLIVSVIDHGRSGQRTVEPQHVETMVQAQRELAFEEGCAFFDSVTAMGGSGSLRQWFNRKPRLASPDLKHLNARGREVMGEMMFNALMAEYAKYQQQKR